MSVPPSGPYIAQVYNASDPDVKASDMQAALTAKADIASPTLTGTPSAPTATAGTNTTQIATTAFVKTEVAAVFPEPVTMASLTPVVDIRFDTVTGLSDGASLTAIANAGSGGAITIAGTPKWRGGVDGRGCVTFPSANDYLSFTPIVGGTGGATWSDSMTAAQGLDCWFVFRTTVAELDALASGKVATLVYNPSGPVTAAGVYETSGVVGGMMNIAAGYVYTTVNGSALYDGGLVVLRISMPRIAANTTGGWFSGPGWPHNRTSFTGTPTLSRIGGLAGMSSSYFVDPPATMQFVRSVIFDRWLTDPEAAKVNARLQYDHQLPYPCLMPLGNSLTAMGASGATTEAGSWQANIQTDLKTTYPGLSVRPQAVSGRGTREILSNWTTNVLPSLLRSPGKTVVPVWEGTNDMTNASVSARQAAGDLLRQCDLVYANGGLPILLTILPRQGALSGETIATFETKRLAVNILLRRGALDRNWLAFYDIANDPQFAGFLAGALCAGDNIHLSNAGRTAVALALRPLVVSALEGRIGREGTIREALSASTDNWDRWPCRRCLLNVTGSINLTGRTAAGDGWTEEYVNVGTGTLTVKHDVTSTAANRFYCASDTDVTVGPRGSFRIQYDLTAARWRVF
jgi:lysophospholipase L1-like esterase